MCPTAIRHLHICHKARCKRTQHCWPTTPNIVGCNMLCLFSHPVACCCVLLHKVWNRSNFLAPCKRTQHCWELLRLFARSLIYLVCPSKFCITFLFNFSWIFRGPGPKREWRQCIYSQQSTTTCNRMCKRTQHVTTNDVASVCTGLYGWYANGEYRIMILNTLINHGVP